MIELLTTPELKESVADELAGVRARFAAGRAAAGLTLKQVAAGAGVSFVAVSQFERGVSSMSLAVFLRCCARLHLRTDYVLHGTGPVFIGGRPASGKPRRATRVS